ncbi:RHS repeat-associated core domain-containing protein [Pseudomonas sp. NPDC007930]|uniref:RHS repeat-associated core domain-containing protein n=1 Tax=Pseudomonas sp. NPDC007930 TaxID=3364417 RepID=UPI0036E89953
MLVTTHASGTVLHRNGLLQHYDAFGYGPARRAAAAFNGLWREPGSGLYLLGQGRRGYSPTLRRLLAADAYSPFGAGGINAYAYANAEPVGRWDPSGRGVEQIGKQLGKLGRLITGRPDKAALRTLWATPLAPEVVVGMGPGRTMEVIAHGLEGRMLVHGELLAPDEAWRFFGSTPASRRVLDDASQIHLVICHSADSFSPGREAFGAGIHRLSGRPVRAYNGEAIQWADLNPLIDLSYTLVPHQRGQMLFTTNAAEMADSPWLGAYNYPRDYGAFDVRRFRGGQG